MKFKVGQIWKDVAGEQWEIKEIHDKLGLGYPVQALNMGTGRGYSFTIHGRCYLDRPKSPNNLIKLIEGRKEE